MSNDINIQEIGRIMGEQLQELDSAREAVQAAAARREEAAAEEAAAAERYRAKVQEVRSGGFVTDALLEKSGHSVGKRRGRPAKSAAVAS
ncbi:hypothetical protein [Rhodococcus pyridinivorans]|uniref:hypothetical protein n=1 Tax=Rhodococcus pyridinivorans TaxID=103816 RepID=UPI00265AEEC7|nr:hypothetical protein [Rhodococcus pyridinivorans]